MRVVVFNVENLFLYLDRYQGDGTEFEALREFDWQQLSSSKVKNKSLLQTQWIARVIKKLDPDIIMLCEVGGPESLQNFARYFLEDTYIPHIVEGNSKRGIDIGYLTKKSLPYPTQFRSHRTRSLGFLYPHEQQSIQTGYVEIAGRPIVPHTFSRDVAELTITTEFGPLIFFLVHLKSKLDNQQIDPLGMDRRSAELKTLVQIYHERRAETFGRIPILIGGDFNGIAWNHKPDIEFQDIYKQTDLVDVLEIANVPLENRYTHMTTGKPYHRMMNQIDYLFVSPHLQPAVNPLATFVYRYEDKKGREIPSPLTVAERNLLPSDHYALVCEFDLAKIKRD
jgi:endonuclease/exonuclease/phosphatase family metal-dependent hydrolase